MSMFHCFSCDIDFDSDYTEMFKVDDLEVCEDCYEQSIELEGGQE